MPKRLIYCGKNNKKNERGVVAILCALLLPVLIGFVAFSIDIGNVVLVKNELQNSADATALAAAACLFGRTDCGNLNAATPDWSTAITRGTNFAKNNSVANSPVKDVTIDYGYWDIASLNPSLQALPYTPKSTDAPAIRVTVNKTSGKNNGELNTFFAKIWGINSVPVSASAVAVVTSPGSAGSGSLFPIAISKCLFDNYWDAVQNKPKNATEVHPPGTDPSISQTIGTPYIFKVNSTYTDGVCVAGQWTSFGTDANDTPTIKGFIDSGNSGAISVGDSIWIQPGAKATIYPYANDCSAAGTKACEFSMVPVVNSVDTHIKAPVVGLACLRILSGLGGSHKYVLVQMTYNADKCKALNSGGTGPGFGLLLPPRLAR